MIQNNNAPDILNLNAYASYAKDDLLYSADDVLSPAVKSDLLEAFVKSGTYKGKLYGMPDLSSARALFYNKDHVRQGRHRRAAEDLGRVRGRRQEDPALGGGSIGYAMPLGPEEAQAEFSIWTGQQRRRLEDRRQVDDQLGQERRDAGTS